ncbi:hypothetical protein BJF81_00380 [Ornithinimicrobium sp. CNJ-824]|uniref:hypothetical protein n=1 Tax=Ornithinimicrobium sp. CNJ-824 TaxID=1904966 RepID=UPI0009643C78|nr:hypothetical protein [Ornithinimicrobium sp. CNJ-824]OLT22358.1 hypothetical protein BJF81_00380 [Ornithinimicrobium sp. CNJ-824]
MSSTRIRLASLVAVGMLALTGCSDAPGAGSTTPAPSTAAPTTAEPVATTEAPADDAQTASAPPELSAEEQDEADIEETLQLYTVALSDAFNGDESIEGIYPFSRDAAREKWVTEVMAAQAQELSFSGTMDVEAREVTVGGETAEAVACLDVSAVQAVDEDGNSVITEDRLDRTLQDYVLERDDSAQLGWYIVEDTNRNEPCDG